MSHGHDGADSEIGSTVPLPRGGLVGSSSAHALDDGLRALIARGFRFQHVTNEHGQLSVIVGSYGWPGFWDRIHILDEHAASAARMTADGDTIVWGYDGDTLSTISALLELPAPDDRSAPKRSRRAPSGLWLPPRTELAFQPGPPLS